MASGAANLGAIFDAARRPLAQAQGSPSRGLAWAEDLGAARLPAWARPSPRRRRGDAPSPVRGGISSAA